MQSLGIPHLASSVWHSTNVPSRNEEQIQDVGKTLKIETNKQTNLLFTTIFTLVESYPTTFLPPKHFNGRRYGKCQLFWTGDIDMDDTTPDRGTGKDPLEHLSFGFVLTGPSIVIDGLHPGGYGKEPMKDEIQTLFLCLIVEGSYLKEVQHDFDL
jgi:hypothetical protein